MNDAQLERWQLQWVKDHPERVSFWRATVERGPRHFFNVAREWAHRDGWEKTDQRELWYVMGLMMGGIENLCDRLDELSGRR